MPVRRILCALLSALLLSGAALAAEANTPAQEVLFPVRVWGQIVSLSEDQVALENSNPDDPYSSILLHITDETLILDAVDGSTRSVEDLRSGETVYAYAGPAMALSQPPQSTAQLILCRLPADFGAPLYTEIQSVTAEADGSCVAATCHSTELQLTGETKLLAGPGWEGDVTLDDITPGTRVLAWYNSQETGNSSQLTPYQVMVFPSTYRGWLTADENGVQLNGTALELTGAQAPFSLDGEWMLPLRPVAEALGYEVLWNPDAPELVELSRDGVSFCRLDLNTGSVTDSVNGSFTATPVQVTDGVTFLTCSDTLALFGLKYAG